jgi:hypothetical protein
LERDSGDLSVVYIIYSPLSKTDALLEDRKDKGYYLSRSEEKLRGNGLLDSFPLSSNPCKTCRKRACKSAWGKKCDHLQFATDYKINITH